MRPQAVIAVQNEQISGRGTLERVVLQFPFQSRRKACMLRYHEKSRTKSGNLAVAHLVFCLYMRVLDHFDETIPSTSVFAMLLAATGWSRIRAKRN